MAPRLAKLGGTPIDLMALPKVTIDTTAAAPILDKVNYVNATITVAGQGAISARATQIRGRGNTTWNAPKKPYRLKLAASTSLVPGVAASKDWVLLANYYDPSCIRTLIATEIANRTTGLGWTPQFRPVELILNGIWQGAYLLGEHVKVATDRINIPEPAATDTSGLAVTGGYTLEIDQRLESDAQPGFRTPIDNVPIVFDTPDGSVLAQKNYIQQWITDFEAALHASSWLDPATGYARLIDMPSWIDWYLVNELCATLDSNYWSSCKLYKTRDTSSVPGRLYFGPVWDFDNSLGNSFGYDTAYTGWWTRTTGGGHVGSLWHNRMLDDPTFYAATKTRWAALKAALLGGGGRTPIAQVAQRYGDLCAFAVNRDARAWTYAADAAAGVADWLTNRIAWVDANL